ncbi:MAG: cytochrome c [Alphaproteobacteria bacterium]|nr:cytochrome c [Alphaproteobacteria bacterium]
MSEGLTKSAARNIFFGGTIFFFVVLIALAADSVSYINSQSTNVAGLTESVARGKAVWERHSCINCHTLLGEGAYYAPELGNVWNRFGGEAEADVARDGIKEWIKSQPTGIEGRRQMPHFDISDSDLDALVDFFRWTNSINTQNWPPNNAG